jgi:hypothetical protein
VKIDNREASGSTRLTSLIGRTVSRRLIEWCVPRCQSFMESIRHCRDTSLWLGCARAYVPFVSAVVAGTFHTSHFQFVKNPSPGRQRAEGGFKCGGFELWFRTQMLSCKICDSQHCGETFKRILDMVTPTVGQRCFLVGCLFDSNREYSGQVLLKCSRFRK